MNEFDDLARDNYRKTRPAQPPVDGWNRLQRDLETKPVAGVIPTRFGSGFVWGSLAGAVAVFLLLKLLPGQAGALAVAPCAEESVIVETARVPITSQSAPLPISTTATKPSTEQFAIDATGSLSYISASPGVPGTRDRTVPAVRQEENKATTDKSVVADLPKHAVVTHRAEATDLLSVSTIPAPRYRIPATKFGELPPIWVAADALGTPNPKWTFERTDREAQPAHRWEVGGSVFAWRDRQTYFGYELADAPTPFDDQGITTFIDNQDRTFYRTGAGLPTKVYNEKRPLGYRTAYLEVAHQFPKGLRLGVGLLGIKYGSGGNRRPAEVFSALSEGREFTLVETRSDFALYASFNAQYTLFRRHRFRVSPGFALMSRISLANSTTQFISVNGEVPSGSQSSATRTSGRPFLWPSLNLQYQLTRRISLSGDVFPGIGIGARYHLE